MTDRRDTDEELATLLSELEETLTKLRGSLDEGDAPVGRTGRDRRRDAGWREKPPFPRPPSMRELLRFTEQQTIPTLVAILEVNIRLLNFAAAALRAVDPERSAVESGENGAVSRALDAGRGLSTDRLTSGLDELQEALSGTEAPNPEARELLEDAERLSAEVRARLQESERHRGFGGRRPDAGATESGSSKSDDSIPIEVEDATTGDEEPVEDDDTREEDAVTDSGVDVDAELDSIRDEVRGDADDGADESRDGDSVGGADDGNDTENVKDGNGTENVNDDETGGDRVADDE